MVSIVTKHIKGNEYQYLVVSIRKGNTIQQKTIKYIGKKRPIPKEEFACMQLSFENKDWVLHRFEDELSYQDHALLKNASQMHTDYLKILDSVSREKEQEKFLSVFIANSNAIEGSTMTPSDTFKYLFEDVIPKGKTKKELFMATNLYKAWQYIEKNKQKFPSKEHIKTLHALVNDNIEDSATLGVWKPAQNYVGTALTSSYLFVDEKMTELLQWIKKAESKMDIFEIVFQSHVQFEVIHPFVDGNGRVGRLLMNWLLLRKKLAPIAIDVKKRGLYLEALENARRGKLLAICKFCKKEYLDYYNFK